MASTNNFNSKRKRKASFSSSESSSPRNTNMDGNTSQFIDYLSNVNNHNQTGMSEESLLLSPIFRSAKSDDRVTTPLAAKEFQLIASSSSKMKRRRRSSVLGLQHRQEEASMEMNQSDVFNSSPVMKSNAMATNHDAVRGGTNVNSENGENHKTADEGNVMKGCLPSNESISMGDVKTVSFSGRDEHGNHEEIKVTTPYWKSTLDESACPSLGLGSIGTEMTCRSSEEYLLQSQQLQDGDCVNVDEATSVHEDMGQQKVERVDKICKGANVKDNDIDVDKCEIAKEQESRSKDESGISFDSSLLDQSDEESLQDSMQADEEDNNVDNDDNHFEGEEGSNMNNTISIPSNEAVEAGDECENATTSKISPRVSTRVTISPKEQVTSPTKVETTLKDEIDVGVTPHSASLGEHTEEDKEEFVSPSTSIEKIRLGLTPKLKKLREKLIRESMQGEQGDEHASELDATLNTAPIAKQEEKMPTAKDIENDFKIVASDLSLTPALKSFRSKLLRDSLSIGEFDDNPMACLGSPYGHGNNNPTTKDHITEIDVIVGVEEFAVRSVRQNDDKENVRPWNMSNRQGTRRKEQSNICPNTDLPICEAENVDEHLSPSELRHSFQRQPQFLSPSLRQSTNSTTNATSTGSKGRSSKRVVFEDDLYLDQPIDLSSAKKNLNAQSSALVERLRGAAQKRMMSITRTRDSLAMKESMQEQRSMNTNKDEAETSADDTPLDTLQHSPCETASNKVEVCHDANVDPQNVPIPLIEKRPTTVPISPKLGLRRDVTQKHTIPKKQILSSTEKITEGNKPRTRSRTNGSSTFTLNFTKRKPLTIPKSPLLGSRRKSDKTMATKPKSSARTIHASPPVTWSKFTESISPVGLEFLSRTPPNTEDSKQNENAAAPFTLHTQIRAKERAKYEASRILNEKLRDETMQKERERLLREKYKELDSLKKTLR